MAWVAVGKNGEEMIFDIEPTRNIYGFSCFPFDRIKLPKGSIKKLIGRDLTWNDEPVKLEEN